MEGGDKFMTQVIDGRVVEMKFDNSDFEKNVAQSMSTIEKLKQSLNFDSAKSLEDLGKATKGFDMSNVSSTVDSVQAHFSALQVIGYTALSEITKAAMHLGSTLINKVIAPIRSGGMNRALNIEQAKFQLEGLGVAWKDIEEDINYGVKDTAYGLDVAAKAASQLTASGVTLGDEMKAALRGISGVASMTSSSYEEISPIFTTVAGQGKVMTMQLRQLEARGLNAAATLAKSLGTTEAAVREMVKDGKIDFQTFSKAMDDAFGSHAKDANKTFTGAMSNVRAALSRIGANFATPYMDNMRLIFVETIDVINGINKALNPIYKDVSGIMEIVQKGITGFLKQLKVNDVITPTVNAIRNSFYALLLILRPIKQAFDEIFPTTLIQRLSNTAQSLEKFTSKLTISEKDAENVKKTFKGLFAVIDIIGKAFKAAFNAITPFIGGLGRVLGNLLSFTGGIGDYLVNLDEVITKNNTFGKAFSKVANVVQHASDYISKAIKKITDTLKEFKQNHIDNKDFSGFTNFIDAIKRRLQTFDSASDVLKKILGKIKEAFSNFVPFFKGGVQVISDSIGILIRGFAEAFKGNGNDPFTAFINLFSTASVGTMFTALAQSFAQITKQVKNMGGLSSILFEVKNVLKGFQADLKAGVLTKLATAIAVFAGSLFVLSMINPTRLISSMAAVEVLIESMKSFTMFTTSIEKMSIGSSAGFIKIAGMMISLSAAVLILSGAVKTLSKLDFLDLVKGLGSVLLIIKALSDQAVLLSNMDTKIMKGASTMIALGVAVRILASAVKTIGNLAWYDVIQGMAAVLILIKALADQAVLLSNFDTKVMKGAGVMVAMALAIDVLSIAVLALGKMKFEEMLQGLGAVIALMYAFSMTIGKIDANGIVRAGFALIEVAAAMTLLTGVVFAFAKMKPLELIQGLGAVITLLVAMSGVLALLSKNTKAGDLAGTAGALILLGAAVTVLSAGLKVLSTIPFLKLAGDLILLLAALIGFASLSSAVSAFIPVMLAMSGTIALLGAGVLALGAGITLLSVGLATLATSATAVVANLGAIAVIISTIIPAIFTAAANGIIQFVVTLGNGAAAIVAALVNLGHEILSGISTLLPDIVNLVCTSIEQLLEAIVRLVPAFVNAAIRLITGLIEGINSSMPALIKAGNDLFINFINSMAEEIRRSTPLMIDAMDNLMDALINAGKMWLIHFVEGGRDIVLKIIEGMKQLWETIKRAGGEVVESAKNGIKEGIKGVVQLGRDFVNGFIEGIKELADKVWDAASGLAKKALSAIKRTQNSNSPAKETKKLGGDFGDGYTLGIKSKEGDAKKAGTSLTNAALNPIKAGAAQIPTLFGPIAEYSKRFGLFTDKSKDSTAELRKEMIEIKKPTKDYGNEVDSLAEGEEKLAESTKKATSAGKEQKSFLETMQDTISNQLDIFSKFEIKQGITAETMLENMKSNIDGFASWSHRLAVLAERGIDQALYQKLAEMGPKGYETVAAFVQMTDEQLKQANQLFATSMTLPESQAAIVQSGFTYAGEMAVKGFSNALNDHKAAHDAAHGMGKAAVEGVDQALDIHSPSKVMWQRGWYSQLGYRDGLRDGQVVTLITVGQVCNAIVEEFKTELAPEKFEKIGNQVVADLFTNMLKTNEGEEGNPIVQALVSGLQTFELVDAALTTFSRHVKDMFNSLFEIGSDGGQSMWSYKFMQLSIIQAMIKALADNEILMTTQVALFCLKIKNMFDFEDMPGYTYNIGMNVALGLKQGIEDYAEEAVSAARRMAEEVMAILASIPEIHSPSRVARKLGGFIPKGYALGIEDGAKNVYKAAKSVAKAGIDGMRSGKIKDLLKSEFDFNPVITPILDLSYIKAQIEELNSLMTIPVDVVSQNEGNSSKNTPSQINFTQNNYSPKALSRYELYRQTKNQISQLKGVMG